MEKRNIEHSIEINLNPTTLLQRSVPEELEAFSRESSKLWKVSLNKRPFVCLSRGEMQVSRHWSAAGHVTSTLTLIGAEQAQAGEAGHGRGEEEVSSFCHFIANFSHKFQHFIARCRAISKENKQFKETVETQERMIESQNFVMTNLRNGIDYLKATCKNAGTM